MFDGVRVGASGVLGLVLGALLALVAVPSQAVAQPMGAQAEALFQDGRDLMAAGKFAEACSKFEASQKLEPRVTTLINLGGCRAKLGQLATAWGLFLEAEHQTRAGADPVTQQLHEVAQDLARKLKPRLSTLRIDVPPASQIPSLELLLDGKAIDPATWNTALPIDGGKYTISARAPGHSDWSSTIEIAPEQDAKSVAIPKLPDATATQRPPQDKQPAHASAASGNAAPAPEDRMPALRDDAGTWSAKRKIGVGLAAGGVIGLTIGTVLGVSAKRKQSDAYELCPEPVAVPCNQADAANALIEAGHDRSILANVVLGAGVAAVLTGGVLWFTGAPEPRGSVAVAPVVSLHHVVFTASGRF